MPYPSQLLPEPLTLRQSTADLYLHKRCSNTVLSQSLWGPWVLVCTRFVWAFLASLVEMRFDSKCKFILLPSCWGFSFVLGCGVSLHSCSSTYHLTGVSLTLDLEYLLSAAHCWPRRKEQWPHKRLTQTCLWVSRGLQQSRRSVVACCRVGGTECSSTSMGFWWGRHYLLYLHQNSREGTHLLPSTENGIKDLLSMAPPIRTRPSFPLS